MGIGNFADSNNLRHHFKIIPVKDLERGKF